MLTHLRALATTLLLVVATGGSATGEVIEIRTGQVGGVPGTPPTTDHNGPLDDCFRVWAAPECGVPLSGSPFATTDFQAARTSPNIPELIVPAAGWLPSLPADPDARWINWNHGTIPGGSGDPPASVLYACDFAVESASCADATVQVWWAVDDVLGDPAGPNPVGIYLNGIALPAAFSGGGKTLPSYAIASGIPLNPGLNTLYAYQADTGCVVSGLILSARIICGDTAELRGTKYHDLDCDGVRDVGEPGLPNWTIHLSGPVSSSTTTDANGDYAFVVPPGTYTLSEGTQAGWILTDPPGGVHTVTVTGGDVQGGLDFGNCICEEPLDPLLPCTVAYYPFDEGGGSTAHDVAGSNDATTVGAPGWGGGYNGSGSSLVAALPTDHVDGGSLTAPQFGSGHFAVSAWIRSPTGNVTRTIVDKTDPTSGIGWHFFLDGERLALETDDGFHMLYQSATSQIVADGSWHHVVAVVCRDLSGSETGGVTFYVDGLPDAFFSQPPIGSVDTTTRMRIGQRTTGTWSQAIGEVDEVMVFDCCLDDDDVQRLTSFVGFSSGSGWVPSVVTASGSTAATTLQLCNLASTTRTYTWTIAALTAGGTCTVPGPVSYTPSAGSLAVPPGGCVSVPITIHTPAWLGALDVGCYRVTVLDDAGGCFRLDGRVRGDGSISGGTGDPVVHVPVFESREVAFELENGGPDPIVTEILLAPWSRFHDAPSGSMGIDGLPPGEPVVRTVKIPPESIAPVIAEVLLERHDAFDVQEVQLRADILGDGSPVTIVPVGVRSIGETILGQTDPALPPPARPLLRVAPTPFAASTEIRFEVRSGAVASLRVFDVAGRHLRTLVAGQVDPGPVRVTWDGTRADGTLAPPGVYWVRLDLDGSHRTRKVVRRP